MKISEASVVIVGKDQPAKMTSHRMMTPVDAGGTRRGACKESTCFGDCKEYWCDPEKGTQCQCCGCFPAKHQIISNSPVMDRNITVLENDGADKAILCIENKTSQTIQEGDHIVKPTGELEPIASSPLTQDNSSSLLSPGDSTTSNHDHQTPQASPRSSTSNLSRRRRYLDNDDDEEEDDHMNVAPKKMKIKCEPVDSDTDIECHFHSTGSSHDEKLTPEAKKSIAMPSSEVNETQAQQGVCSIDSIRNKLTRQELYRLCVPSKLPGYTEKSVKEADRISSPEKQFILRWMVWTMFNLQLSTDRDFTEVASLAIIEYPVLEGPLTNGVKGIVKSMKEILRNHNYYLSKKKKGEEVKSNSCESHLDSIKDLIQNEMSKDIPSVLSLKSLLSSCRKERKAIARKQNCATHLKEFPCLKMENLLFWELCQQEALDVSMHDFKMRWIKVIPKMAKYFSTVSSPLSNTLSNDQTTIEILQRLTTPSFFGARKPRERRERSSHVIEIFKERTQLSKTLPAKDDPPRLIGVGDVSKDDLRFYIYVDEKPVYSGKILNALIKLVALYYVFDITPAPDAKAAMAFIFGIFLHKGADKDFRKYRSVLKALEATTCTTINWMK